MRKKFVAIKEKEAQR